MTRFVRLGGRLGLEAKAITAIVGCSTNRAPTNREALIPRPDPPRIEPPLAVARWANGNGSCPSHCRRGRAGHRVTCGEVGVRRYRPRRAGQPLPRGGTPNVPPHQVLEADRGVDFATITRNHLALLDLNAAIKARFLSEPDWLNLYGLPNRYEEHEVNGHSQGLQLLRAQRTVFVIWNMPDKVKKLSNVIIPNAAKSPVLADAVAQLPVFNAGDALCAARSDYIRRLDRRQRRRPTHLRHSHRWDGRLLGKQHRWLRDLLRPALDQRRDRRGGAADARVDAAFGKGWRRRHHRVPA